MSWAGRAQQWCCCVFIGALRFCFARDELGIETTTRLYWEGFYVQGSGKGTGTGCALTTVRGWESSWVWPLQRLELGSCLSEAHSCPGSRIFPCSAPCSLISPEQSRLPFLPCPSCFCSALFCLLFLFFRTYFFFCFYTVVIKLKGSCYECLWVLLPSDRWADEGFLRRGVNVRLWKGTVRWTWWYRSRAGS